MRYTVSLLPVAAKQLGKIDPQTRRRVGRAIDSLEKIPRPAGCKKLVGVDAWRVRVGDFLIIYQIRDAELIVLVVRVGHRRDVYE